MIKISCIIPAYNEASRIGNVLEIVSTHALIDEVIVVDDGSSDGIKEIVGAFKNVRLITHAKNRGKSAAVHTGINASTGEFLLFLDADLIGLTEENITGLLTPVLQGRADMSLSLRGNTPKPWRMIGLDYISGERVFPKQIIANHVDEILKLPGFGLEVFLNRLVIRHHSRIAVVHWPNVESPYKHRKYGLWKGLKRDVGMIRDIFRTVSPLGPLYQIAYMLNARVKNYDGMTHTISFVIPAHNEEKYIGRCLESVVAELARGNYRAEVIVVNNVSTDRTRQIALSFPGVQVVDEPEKGLVRARRKGFLASTSDLVANIDADTIVPEGWLETVMKEFHKNEKMAALSGPFIYYELSPFSRMLVKIFYIVGFLTHLFNQHVLKRGAMLQGGNFVLRRAMMEAIGGYDTSISFHGEDTDVARRISAVGRVKWTFRLPILASARRLKQEGIIAAGIRYAINYLWMTFLERPFTREHRDIRE